MSPAKLDQGAATAGDNDNDSDNSNKRSSSSSSSKSRERSGDSSNETTTITTTTGSAVRGASLLIILQIASRALTFLANQLLLRFLTAQLLGVSTQLEVYYLSVLFFARESLRVAIQRQSSSSSSSSSASATRDSQSVVNLAYLSLLLGLGVAAALGAAYLRYVDAATAASTPYLDVALYIYAAAALIELLSEPAFVVLQYRLRFGPRAAAESLATFLRCLVTLGAANWAWARHLELGVLPFALGQLAYGAGLLVVYAGYGFQLAAAEGFSLFPRRATATTADEKKNDDDDDDDKASSYVLGYFYRPTLHLASSLMSQSFVKHLLTQGDTFLVSALSDPASQGVYALANNYGGLLARLVFQPVEESSRNYFSKLLSSSSSSSSSSSAHQAVALARARTDLQSLLRFYLVLSLVIVAAGPFAAPLLVQLVAGSRWSASGAGGVLARYCLYVPLLAINGVAEAFVSSVAAESEVHRQSLWMGAFSCAFGVAGFVTLHVLGLGAAGLVYANAINMLCRIAWSGAFISRYFAKNDEGGVGFGWDAIVPRGLPLYVLGTAMLWSALSRAGIEVGGVSTHIFKDLFTVAAGAVPYVILIAYAERQYLLDSYRSIRGKS
ncbi:Rft-1-domain-containing protein [Biscogniauxia mediterranea]|nr:Rft-1-domain-containing protein [Biscogniauxia mediterranea]